MKSGISAPTLQNSGMADTVAMEFVLVFAMVELCWNEWTLIVDLGGLLEAAKVRSLDLDACRSLQGM